ncbi:MAG: GGDEF domain-containing protein [Rhodanobacteraceae bacterium]
MLFAALALVLSVVAVQVYRIVGELVDESGWVAHTHQVREQIVSTVAKLRNAEAALRAYVVNGDTIRLESYYAALPELDRELAGLRAAVADNPEQVASTERLEEILNARRASMRRIVDVYRERGLEGLRADAESTLGQQQDDAVDVAQARMLAIENALLVQRQEASREAAQHTRWMTFGAIALCFVMLASALVAVVREQRRRVRSELHVNASNAELAASLDESRRLGGTLRQLSELGEMLQGCRSLDEAAVGLEFAIGKLLPSTSGTVNLINSSQNLVTPLSSWGAALDGEAVFAPDDCWALRRGQPYPEPGTTPAFTCRHLGENRASAPHSRLCVPLLAQGSMFGTILVATDGDLTTEQREAAVAAAEQISLAISNLRLQETLRTQSLRDPLTGLFNRRYLEVSLARDLARAVRRHQPLAVLMLDIDNFKTFNDSHGHEAGDKTLMTFGELLGSLSRSEDVACRYGGEEFTLVLQEADAGIALDRAEEIRRAASDMIIEYRRQAIGPVTVSIGIACYPMHGDTPEQLIRRADRALYIAKEQGRNRVCVAGA